MKVRPSIMTLLATVSGALSGRIWATSDGSDHGATWHLVMPLPDTAAMPRAAAAI